MPLLCGHTFCNRSSTYHRHPFASSSAHSSSQPSSTHLSLSTFFSTHCFSPSPLSASHVSAYYPRNTFALSSTSPSRLREVSITSPLSYAIHLASSGDAIFDFSARTAARPSPHYILPDSDRRSTEHLGSPVCTPEVACYRCTVVVIRGLLGTGDHSSGYQPVPLPFA